MQADFNLEAYLSKGIETLIKKAVKSTLKNPKESAFLLKYAAFAQKAAKVRADAESRGVHIPPFLIASITGQCNLNCTGCYAKAGVSCGQTELDVSEWERIFTEAKEMGIAVILMAGGEPFMRPEVIAKAADRPEILFPIFTNGTTLCEQDYKMLDKNRNLVPVLSIEGDEVTTDARRGSGVHARLENVMGEFKRKNLFFGASITVTKNNLEMVTDEAFIDSLYQKGCKIIFYIEYVPFDSNIAALTDKERVILENKLVTLRKKEMIFISFPGDEKGSDGCLAAGRGFFHIAASGNAEPCPFSPYSDTSLRNHSLKEALSSPMFAEITSGDILRGEHTGGCVLFEQDDVMKTLVNISEKIGRYSDE